MLETVQSANRVFSVTIVGGFLDRQTFELADGLNCVIGARGTGKTTVLEFVRYAMDALPPDGAARKRIESLVEQNLAGGRVEIHVRTKGGLSYIVTRSAGDDPVVLPVVPVVVPVVPVVPVLPVVPVVPVVVPVV